MKMLPAEMNQAADQASALLKSLANRHRLLIACQLIERPHAVGELAHALGIRDSTVSQHLALMRKDGLIAPRREGQTIWYTIASPKARRIVETLYALYCGKAASCAPAKPKRAAPGAKSRDAKALRAGAKERA